MRKRLWLLLPAWGFFAADVMLTLLSQPATYWAGDYANAVEHNFIGKFLLVRHPTAFIIAALVWAAFFGSLVLCWRDPVTNWLAILLAIGHAVGGSTWLAQTGTMGWIMAVVYLALGSWLAGICWRRASNP